jgi:hypothetical protein
MILGGERRYGWLWRGDEERIVGAFSEYLTANGWSVTPEVDFCDLVANRDGGRLFVEAKGRTTSPGLDVDTLYGQLLRRMPMSRSRPPGLPWSCRTAYWAGPSECLREFAPCCGLTCTR